MRFRSVSLDEICLRLIATLVFLLALLPLTSVEVDAAPTYTEVGGPITADTTWTLANSPYIVNLNIQVMTGVTLTIEPGVVVKFDTDRLLQVDGTLIAQGTVNDPITFTSDQDTPQPGDWGSIQFTDSSVNAVFDGSGNYTNGSILQYCVVEYAGRDDAHDGAIETYDAAPFIDHCTVRDNSASGIYGEGTSSEIVVISNNSVHNNINSNWGTDGGGISVTHGVVEDNEVYENTSFYHNGGGIYAYGSTVTGNILSGNFANSSGGGIYATRGCTVTNNIVIDNWAEDDGGGMFVIYDGVVTGNTVTGNLANNRGGGIYAYGSILVDNEIVDNLVNNDGGGLYASRSTATSNTIASNWAEDDGGGTYLHISTAMSNTIAANGISATGHGSGAYLDYSLPDFLYNTVVYNTSDSPTEITGGVEIDVTTSNPRVQYNNLYGNSPYDVVIASPGDISGTHNYWGTTATVDILAQVYDWYDDPDRGRMLYVPYLQEPSSDSPVPPPQNLQVDFDDGSANLSWDAIPDAPSGYGYKVYYDNDTSAPPYDGTGATEGDSPIDVGNVTVYTLTGLGEGVYYVAVTAYDSQGREGWYSDVANSFLEVYLPLVLRNP